MDNKVVKIITYIGEESWLANTLENSLVNDGQYECPRGKIISQIIMDTRSQ